MTQFLYVKLRPDETNWCFNGKTVIIDKGTGFVQLSSLVKAVLKADSNEANSNRIVEELKLNEKDRGRLFNEVNDKMYISMVVLEPFIIAKAAKCKKTWGAFKEDGLQQFVNDRSSGLREAELREAERNETAKETLPSPADDAVAGLETVIADVIENAAESHEKESSPSLVGAGGLDNEHAAESHERESSPSLLVRLLQDYEQKLVQKEKNIDQREKAFDEEKKEQEQKQKAFDEEKKDHEKKQKAFDDHENDFVQRMNVLEKKEKVFERIYLILAEHQPSNKRVASSQQPDSPKRQNTSGSPATTPKVSWSCS